MVYKYRIIYKSTGERILKIGPNLSKLLANIKGYTFFETQSINCIELRLHSIKYIIDRRFHINGTLYCVAAHRLHGTFKQARVKPNQASIRPKLAR